MPIYEYRCKACGKKFDKLVRMSTRTEDIECPECGRRKAEKSVSSFASLGGRPAPDARLSNASCGPSA